MTQSAQDPNASSETIIGADWFGQPRGLTILFLTETWTTFSFFGMRTLLVYYMTKELMISQERSSLIYGGYAAAVYFTPIFGGVIADRLLGKFRAVVLGALLMAAGHFMMAFESLFFPALAAIALGNGFFLPSLSSQINTLYRSDDPRLASAYNIYYVGINIGAFAAPFVCGTLGETYGWHWGFTAAGIGMLTALLIYLRGARYLPAEQHAVQRIQPQAAGDSSAVRDRLLLLFGIMATVVVFRGAYEQVGNTIALWTDTGTDRAVTLHWSIPMTWFQALNPLLIFLLTPPLVAWWTRLALKGREPFAIKKMVAGAILVGVSYLFIAGIALAAQHSRAGWPWLALFFVVMTGGELLILPVGLGLFGRLAPKGFEATAIATWFFAGFAGNLLAGGIGTLWSQLPHPLFFAIVGAIALASAILLLLFVPAGARAERSLAEARPVRAGALQELSSN